MPSSAQSPTIQTQFKNYDHKNEKLLKKINFNSYITIYIESDGNVRNKKERKPRVIRNIF